MKPFDIEKAKAGAPVVTGDGIDVEIITFDRKHANFPIVGIVDDGCSTVKTYSKDGKDSYTFSSSCLSVNLFMKPVKKEGWINIYPDSIVYPSKPFAESGAGKKCITTIRIEWEE